MFANLYIYFICLKLFVKKNTNKFKQCIGFQTSLSFVTTGADQGHNVDSTHLQLHLTKNQKVTPLNLEYFPNYSKKCYFNHFKEVFPENMYFTAKLPNKAPELFAKTSNKSGSLSIVATPCNTSITIP